MSEREGEPRPETRRRRGAALLAFLGGMLLMYVQQSCAEEEPPPEIISTIRPTASVITAVRDLARLESTSFHVERVIDIRDQQSNLFGMVEAEDAVLLVAAGDVSAGLDLTKLADGDVVVDEGNHHVRILLPPPEVFWARLDNERTYVHTRETDVLARRSETLESRARREAEETLRDAAIDSGILARARRNSKMTLETLLRSLGFTSVELSFREE